MNINIPVIPVGLTKNRQGVLSAIAFYPIHTNLESIVKECLSEDLNRHVNQIARYCIKFVLSKSPLIIIKTFHIKKHV